MALARLTKQCRECPFVETCEHKEMEALGYLPEPIMADVKAPVTADIAVPILRETVSRVVDGKVVTMYKDELEKILFLMPRKRMRLILQRNFAIAKKSREKLRRQNLFTKLVASLNKHGSIKSDISERRKET